jgi:hypothetical protein
MSNGLTKPLYEIREFHYDGKGNITARDAYPPLLAGGSIEEIRGVLEASLAALGRKVILDETLEEIES